MSSQLAEPEYKAFKDVLSEEVIISSSGEDVRLYRKYATWKFPRTYIDALKMLGVALLVIAFLILILAGFIAFFGVAVGGGAGIAFFLFLLIGAAIYSLTEAVVRDVYCGVPPNASVDYIALTYLSKKDRAEAVNFLLCLEQNAYQSARLNKFVGLVRRLLAEIPGANLVSLGDLSRRRDIHVEFTRKLLDFVTSEVKKKGFEGLAFEDPRMWWLSHIKLPWAYIVTESWTKAFAFYPATERLEVAAEGAEAAPAGVGAEELKATPVRELPESAPEVAVSAPIEESPEGKVSIEVGRGYIWRKVEASIDPRIGVAILPESLLYSLAAEPAGTATVLAGRKRMRVPFTHVEVRLADGSRVPVVALYGREGVFLIPAVPHVGLSVSRESVEMAEISLPEELAEKIMPAI